MPRLRRPKVPKRSGGRRDTNDSVVSENEPVPTVTKEQTLADDFWNGSDPESIEEDDCPVYNEDNDGYGEEADLLGDEFVEVELGDYEVRQDNDEEGVDNANVDADDEHGIDVWDDDNIPDPLSDSDNEYGEDGRPFRFVDDPEKMLQLGQTFNNAEEFKYALLRYSLKSQYDIELPPPPATLPSATLPRPASGLFLSFFMTRRQRYQPLLS